MTRLLSLSLATLLALAPFAALAEAEVDWNAHKDVETVVIVTADEDGTPRETTIWLCVVDGKGYVRGGSGRWVANTARNGDVGLRVGESELVVHAMQVTDAAEIERVTAAYHEKYGFGDTLAGIVRGEPTIFRLTSR
ncbi:MAG TPA: DUF2255 family protein [Myxococcota bacterium]|nr:DUF2255 family protein [Myxococcota bacterium]